MQYKEEIKELKGWMRDIDKKLDNHLTHVVEDISKIQTDLSWLKKFFWIVATSSITALVGAIFSLLFNGK